MYKRFYQIYSNFAILFVTYLGIKPQSLIVQIAQYGIFIFFALKKVEDSVKNPTHDAWDLELFKNINFNLTSAELYSIALGIKIKIGNSIACIYKSTGIASLTVTIGIFTVT